jgi:WhiB family transcriptional regulator, redox-sensing transcriptional regulator
MTDVRRLPGPNADVWEWQLHGACRGLDVERFFHPDGERGPRRRNREAAAKAVCASCPVLAQCATHALRSREPYGIWGGLSETDREEIWAGTRPAPDFAARVAS